MTQGGCPQPGTGYLRDVEESEVNRLYLRGLRSTRELAHNADPGQMLEYLVWTVTGVKDEPCECARKLAYAARCRRQASAAELAGLEPHAQTEWVWSSMHEEDFIIIGYNAGMAELYAVAALVKLLEWKNTP